MIVREMTLVLIIVLAAVAGGLSLIFSHPNNKVEEAAERIIERKIEKLSGAEEGSLRDTIDLSPWAPKQPEQPPIPAPMPEIKELPVSFDEDC